MYGQPTRVMFVYWGRRGLTQFALEVARAASQREGLVTTISASRQNESFSSFEAFGSRLFPVDTFSTNTGALTQAWRIPHLRRSLASRLRQDKTQVVIDLLPHVWASFVAPVIHANGARYATVIHDAESHPGDYRTGWVKSVLDRSMYQSDVVLTLSSDVAGRIAATGRISKDKIYPLFHPDLGSSRNSSLLLPGQNSPIRLLFLGRIMAYKGLPVFLDAVDLLRAEGLQVEVGVFGEGKLGPCAERLTGIGAEVVNRWLSQSEIGRVLSRFHAVVLSHQEASQSGVVAAAFGAGLPVVATPVGGIREQIKDGETGVLATDTGAPALAAAIKRLLLNPGLFQAVRNNIAHSKDSRSVTEFVEQCVSHALHAGRTDRRAGR